MPELLVVADDLTGALEAGALLAGAGVETEVTLGGRASDAAAVVVDTETRHAGEDQAAAIVREAVRRGRERGAGYLYKKTDSTLRGPIAAELEAAIEGWGATRPLVYLPAYPRMGRTVRGGILYVDGVPLEQTAFGCDPREPARTGSLGRTLRRLGDRVRFAAGVENLRDLPQAPLIIVCDAGREEDLEAAAAALAGSGALELTAGPAGWLGHLVRHMPLARGAPPRRPPVDRGLVVNGSLHPRSIEQVRRAAVDGVPWEILGASMESPAGALERLASEAVRSARAARLDCLAIFGGDTALAVVRELGVDTLQPVGELMDGVAVSRVETTPGILVTKAGGFGAVGLIREMIEKLGGAHG